MKIYPWSKFNLLSELVINKIIRFLNWLFHLKVAGVYTWLSIDSVFVAYPVWLPRRANNYWLLNSPDHWALIWNLDDQHCKSFYVYSLCYKVLLHEQMGETHGLLSQAPASSNWMILRVTLQLYLKPFNGLPWHQEWRWSSEAVPWVLPYLVQFCFSPNHIQVFTLILQVCLPHVWTTFPLLVAFLEIITVYYFRDTVNMLKEYLSEWICRC